MRRRLGLLAALAIVVGGCVGCDPGWVNPVLGTGDGSGSVPGGPPGVAAADVSLGSPAALADLGARGYLAYDSDSCTIMLVADGRATRYAGNGTCGESGDGGPATDASIDVVIAPIGAGLQVDPDGNVYFANASYGTVRRIDATTGSISKVPTVPTGFVSGISAEADGVMTYVAQRPVEAVDGDMVYNQSVTELRRIDTNGDQVIADLSGLISSIPVGLVRVGPEHYVTFTELDDGTLRRVDVDHGSATATSLGSDGPLLVPQAAGADGSIYGTTYGSPTTAYDGNQVFRSSPNGSVAFIAGSGTPDPGTKRQSGSGADLDLSAKAVAFTRNGNLLIASGHVVYDLVDPADAPAIPSSS